MSDADKDILLSKLAHFFYWSKEHFFDNKEMCLSEWQEIATETGLISNSSAISYYGMLAIEIVRAGRAKE